MNGAKKALEIIQHGIGEAGSMSHFLASPHTRRGSSSHVSHTLTYINKFAKRLMEISSFPETINLPVHTMMSFLWYPYFRGDRKALDAPLVKRGAGFFSLSVRFSPKNFSCACKMPFPPKSRPRIKKNSIPG